MAKPVKGTLIGILSWLIILALPAGNALAEPEHIIGEFQQMKAGEDTAQYAKETGELLRHWLVGHVLNRDMRMKGHADTLKREIAGMMDISKIKMG